MPGRTSTIEAAFDRIELLKAIVTAERKRAESEPFGQKNQDRGITYQDQKKDRVEGHIAGVFN